jgi:hypothetical protein
MEASIYFGLPAEVSIRQRDEPAGVKADFYGSQKRVEASVDDAVLRIGDTIDDGVDGTCAEISLQVFHVSDAHTGNVYHATIDAYLTRSEARALRDALTLLIDHAPDHEPDA